MNELDMIRELLAEAPPSAEVIAEGRRRVAGEAAGRGRRARVRPLVPAAGLAAAALVTATAIILAVTAGAPGAGPASRPLTATELAYRAAVAAARQPDVRPGQWVYRKYLTKGSSRLTTTEFWTTADSVKAAWVSAPGKIHYFSGQASLGMASALVKLPGHRSTYIGLLPFQLPVKYTDLGSLPRDPQALDRYLGRQLGPAVPKAAKEFMLIDAMLTGYVMPPGLTAEFYRALGDIPGVTANPHAVDVARRPGVAFRISRHALGAEWTDEIILSPRTYRLMANEITISPAPGSSGQAATVAGTAILREALVSGPGIRP
jgi:hypothetical protein